MNRSINYTQILEQFASDPKIQAVVEVLVPYIPAIKREGIEFYNEVVAYAVGGKWSELDEFAWSKMTNEERNALSDEILNNARDSVDSEFERKQFARECVIKLAGSLLTMLL